MLADLNTLRRWVGSISTTDDETLTECLDSATAYVSCRVYPQVFTDITATVFGETPAPFADLATLKADPTYGDGGASAPADSEPGEYVVLEDDSLAHYASAAWTDGAAEPAPYPDDVQNAILLMANRLYKRRQSPEGSAGFGAEGFVVRIVANDPDIRTLLERNLDMSDAATGVGIG